MSLNHDLPADMHTHNIGQGRYYLLSCSDSSISEFTSRQFHPWHLPDEYIPLDNCFLTDLKNFSALGEIGLDRLRGPDLSVQRRYLDALLEAAESFKIPVVIHNVRCDTELFSALKGFPQNILIHGFRGGAKTLEKYISAGWFVSFSNVNPSMAEYLRCNGLNNTGIESDDSDDNINDIAENISRHLDTDVSDNSVTTFRKFLGI